MISIRDARNLLIFLVGFFACTAQADPKRISVSGECRKEVSSDRAAIVLTAEFRDDDLKAAAKRATESHDRAREAIKRLNLEHLDLRTSEYNVNEVREWEKDRSVLKGYRARMGLRVATSQINRMGEVIAIAAREGMKDVGQLHSFLSDEKSAAERMACLQEAAAQSKAKAEKLASALNAKVGAVGSILEVTSPEQPIPTPVFMTMQSRAKTESDMVPPQVEGGRQSIDVRVQVTFALQ